MSARDLGAIPLQLRFAALGSVDRTNRTAELVWSSGAGVPRYDWEHGRSYNEVLSLDPAHVRMGRLQSGTAPLLDSHQARNGVRSQLGVVTSAALADGQGVAKVRFSQRSEVAPVFQDVADGILRNVSVGYAVHRYEMQPPEGDSDAWTYRATDWEPMELSLVPIGADPGAFVRSEKPETETKTYPCEYVDLAQANHNPKGTSMTTEQQQTTLAAERERVSEIMARVERCGVGYQFAQPFIDRGATLDEFCRALVDEQAKRNESGQIMGTRITTHDNNGGPVSMLSDMSEVLASRQLQGEKITERARQYAGLRVVDIARRVLEMNGKSTSMMRPAEIITRAMHSTSDFPHLLQDTGNRVLRKAYDSYPGGVKSIARRTTAPDFRPLNKLALGEAPTLDKVLEGGEFKRGTIKESQETYSIATYGKIFGVTRQALVNDDLGAFLQMGMKLGRAAAEFENQQIVTLLTSNPTMSDTITLFHTSHSNKSAAPGAISVTTVGAALAAMRLQKGLDGKTPVNVEPRFLVVPAALEVVALQVVAQVTPAQISNVNPFAGRFQVVVDPRLDAISATAWYMAADSSQIDTLEYAYLDGSNPDGSTAAGPRIEMSKEFDTDGIEWKVFEDFGCGVIDFRGLYLNG